MGDNYQRVMLFFLFLFSRQGISSCEILLEENLFMPEAMLLFLLSWSYVSSEETGQFPGSFNLLNPTNTCTAIGSRSNPNWRALLKIKKKNKQTNNNNNNKKKKNGKHRKNDDAEDYRVLKCSVRNLVIVIVMWDHKAVFNSHLVLHS